MTPLKRVAATVAASATLTAGVALLAGTAGAATASFTTPAGAGVVTQLVLDNGGYTKCLNDYGQNVNPGAEVKLYSCVNSPANEWVTYPDNTLRPYLDTKVALTADSSTGDAVLEPVATSGATTAQQWYFDASGMLVNGLSNPGTSNEVLNDPGYVTTNGVQVVVWNQPSVTSNAHWWAPAAHYATSTLSSRPDSGGGGNNWANDHMTRLSLVIFQGDVSGAHQFQGSVSDTGSFHALAGELTPNQGGTNQGTKLGDSISGSLYGSTGLSFTTDQWVSSSPGSSYSGINPSTGSWPSLFFQGTKTTVGGSGTDNSGPMQWAWSYTSNNDVCGNAEHWVDASYNGGGQDSTAGNITAPATCPTS